MSRSAWKWVVDKVVGMRARRQGAGNRDQLVEARARVVIGADGRKSQLARLAGARSYNLVPPLYFAFYSYFRGVEPWERGSYLEVHQALEDGGTVMACPADVAKVTERLCQVLLEDI